GMAQADMPEGVEHALVGEHAARERKLIAEIIDGISHGFSPQVGTAALKPWRQYARRHALWQALAWVRSVGFVLPRMRARASARLVSFCQNAGAHFKCETTD